MSNIVPQQRKGHVVWGKLEHEHRHVVADASKGIKAVWLISGPVFLNGQAEKVIGPDRVGAPHAVYKIVGWQKADGGFTARGDVVKQDDSGSDLSAFLESIDTIEAETGLDFFADLDDEAEEELVSKRFVTLEKCMIAGCQGSRPKKRNSAGPADRFRRFLSLQISLLDRVRGSAGHLEHQAMLGWLRDHLALYVVGVPVGLESQDRIALRVCNRSRNIALSRIENDFNHRRCCLLVIGGMKASCADHHPLEP